MEKRALLLSFGLSFFSMYLVYQYLSQEAAKLEGLYGKENYLQVAVATRDIFQYQTIKPTDVEVLQVPKALEPPGYIANPRDVIDSIAAIPISQGEFILDNKIISKNIYSGLDSQVSVGKRAVSIPVNPKSSVGFMIRPGNRVDLAAHFEFKYSGKAISEAKVFMQDLLVLAAGRTIQTEPPPAVDQAVVREVMSNPSESQAKSLREVKDTLNYAKTDPDFQTLTLEVSPEQAQQIIYVLTVFQDSIIALLRHSDDRQLKGAETTNLNDVMGQDSFYVRSQRPETPAPIVVPRFYDFIGGQPVGVD